MYDNVELLRVLKDTIVYYIENKNVDTFISGMALGIDIWSAFIVLNLKKQYPHIKLISAIPCDKQYSVWKNEEDIEDWKYVVSQADAVHYVSTEPYTNWCLQKRNEWMVDNSNFVLAVWDNDRHGGTWNCIKYAIKNNAKINHINTNDLTVSILNE